MLSPLILVLFLVIIYCLSHLDLNPKKVASIKPKVIIIGAGAAGLSAAVKLLENDIDVTVLEAESRIGGRIRTVHFADGNIELGAHFCHGDEEDNVVYKTVKDLDLLKLYDPLFKIVASNKKKIDASIIEEAHNIFFNEIDNSKDTNNMTSGILFTIKYYKAVIRKFPKDEVKQNKALALIGAFKHLMMILDGTNDWNDSSAYNNYTICEGNQRSLWKGQGYKTFLDVLMKKYPSNKENFGIDSKIQTGKVVKKIIWNEAKVIIQSEGGEEMKADYVIFTPSLGVLKANHMNIFSPALPKNKVKAIERRGYGSIGVFSAHFPVAWWLKDTFLEIQLMWVDETNTKNEKDKVWVKDITSINTVEGNPNVLEIWISGKSIATYENMDELVLIDDIDYVLKKYFYNSTNIVKADKIARGNWLTNPYFRGTYSYETVQSSKMKNPSSVEHLIEPLVNDAKAVVMFAGEATNANHYSTVHGAVETGWREAKRIIDFIKNRN